MSYNWQLIEWRLRFFTHWQMGLDCAKVWNRISITAGTDGKRRWKVKQENYENCCERQVWKVCPRSSAHLCSRVQKVALTSDVYIYIWMMDVSLARYMISFSILFPQMMKNGNEPNARPLGAPANNPIYFIGSQTNRHVSGHFQMRKRSMFFHPVKSWIISGNRMIVVLELLDAVISLANAYFT